MSLTKIANRYAQALFESVKENPSLDAIASDMKSLQAAAQNSPELQSFFKDPVLIQDKKKKVILGLFETKINAVIVNFLFFLVDKRRINVIIEICKIFNQLYLKYKNIAEVQIISAFPIDQDQVDALTKKLSDKFRKEVHTTVTTDSRLIGGLKVKTPDLTFDFSFSTQLSKFRQSL